MEGFNEARESVRRIRARNGSVVLVSLPAALTGTVDTANGGLTGVSWTELAKITGAVCIPLDTGDSHGPFRCSDHVHLGKKQATRMTEYLATELDRNRVLD